MEFYQLNQSKGKKVSQFNSNFIISRIAQTKKEAQISCMYLEPNGVIGYHQATVPQLLLVVSGEGYVRNEIEHYVKVEAGMSVYWSKDEWHETKTDTGLMAIVIECEDLMPALMPFPKNCGEPIGE